MFSLETLSKNIALFHESFALIKISRTAMASMERTNSRSMNSQRAFSSNNPFGGLVVGSASTSKLQGEEQESTGAKDVQNDDKDGNAEPVLSMKKLALTSQ